MKNVQTIERYVDYPENVILPDEVYLTEYDDFVRLNDVMIREYAMELTQTSTEELPYGMSEITHDELTHEQLRDFIRLELRRWGMTSWMNRLEELDDTQMNIVFEEIENHEARN